MSLSFQFELQHLLTKRYVTPASLVEWMCEREMPPKSMLHLVGKTNLAKRRVQSESLLPLSFLGNRSGIALMEMRRKLALGNPNRIPLVAPLKTNAIRSGVSDHMMCFTPESVLHPFYQAEIHIGPEKTAYSSPIHFVVQRACRCVCIFSFAFFKLALFYRFFELDAENEKALLSIHDTLECWSSLYCALNERAFSLEKLQKWHMEERQVALKEAMRHLFEQHQPLLRILLDTEDALLVCCSRFSTAEAELSVGMRERDFRLWCAQIRLTTRCVGAENEFAAANINLHFSCSQLVDLFLRPMAFRPAFLGGNRIGLMLMEIRREFILKGVFPYQLPELVMPADTLLGTESPLENYVPHVEFDIFDEINYTTVWASM